MIKVSKFICGASMMVLAFVSCGSCNSKGGVTPNPPVVTDQGECAAACANLQALACVEGNPIDMLTTCKVDSDCVGTDMLPDKKQQCSVAGKCTVSCTNFCIDTENSGVWLDPTCVKTIKSCGQIESCPAPVKSKNAARSAASCPQCR